MNLAYYRKSTKTLTETIKSAKQHIVELGMQLVGETKLASGKGVVCHFTKTEWWGNLIASDRKLIGLLPTSLIIIEKDEDVFVGVGSASIIGSVSPHPAVNEVASKVEKVLTELVNAAAGVSPLKPVAVKLFSTMTCPYCKMEASWLEQNKIVFEEVHVDMNEREAERMVSKTGQMGVPVTEIVYEDGEEEYVIGFDRQKLSQVFGV